jgi:hypothetical protein
MPGRKLVFAKHTGAQLLLAVDGVPVDVSVEVKAVPGEEKKDNNSAEYDAFFSQG